MCVRCKASGRRCRRPSSLPLHLAHCPQPPPKHHCNQLPCHHLNVRQVPATVRMALAAVASGKCAVIGLQSTGEARTADVVAEKGEELDDFVSGGWCCPPWVDGWAGGALLDGCAAVAWCVRVCVRAYVCVSPLVCAYLIEGTRPPHVLAHPTPSYPLQAPRSCCCGSWTLTTRCRPTRMPRTRRRVRALGA